MDKSASIEYFNKIASEWDVFPRSNQPEKLRAMADRLVISEEARVLDVGTGTGDFLPFISQNMNSGGQIVCVDFAIEMLLQAKRKNFGKEVQFTCAEIENVRFKNFLFDTAVCYSTFPHFHDKPKALGNIFRLLKPGGILHICHTASREAINQIHQNLPNLQDHLVPEYDDMKDLLTKAGFINIQIEEKNESYLAKSQKPEA